MVLQGFNADGLQGFIADGLQAFGGIDRGNVWRLSEGGTPLWSWDSDVDGSNDINGVTTFGNSVYVCGEQSNVWKGTDGSLATVWKLDSSGNVVWSYDTGTRAGEGAVSIAADADFVWVGGISTNNWDGTDGTFPALWKLNASDGSLVWVWGIGSMRTQAVATAGDGTVQVAGINVYIGQPIAHKARAHKIDASGAVVWEWPTVGDPLFNRWTNVPWALAVSGADSWVGGIRQEVAGWEVAKLTNGVRVWGWQEAGVGTVRVRGLTTDGTDSWAVSEELTGFTDQVFKIGAGGAGVWSLDLGGGAVGMRGIDYDSGNVYVGGFRNQDFHVPDDFASLWKILDSDQSITWFWDSGADLYGVAQSATLGIIAVGQHGG